MIFYCQSCGEQQLQAPTSVAIDLTRCKCGSSSFATWQPSFLATQPAPSQTGTPRTADAWADVDQFSHDERQQRRRDLSRQLERELDEAKGSLSRARAGETLQRKAADTAERALSQAKRDAERFVWWAKWWTDRDDDLETINSVGPANTPDDFRAAVDDAALAKREGEGS